MNILIFEYITGGGLAGEALPASLVKEGELMLKAAAYDFQDIADVQLSVMCDSRLQGNLNFENEHIVSSEHGYEEVLDVLASKIDALLIIAPESNNVLTNLCKKYTNQDFMLLNSTPESIALTTNKLKTYEYLQNFNIAQIPTSTVAGHKPYGSGELIIKPIDGAGCEKVQLHPGPTKIADFLSMDEMSNYIAQPYVLGQSASLSLMCWEGKCLLLSANLQIIERAGDSLELKGCVINALDRDSYVAFTKRVVSHIPGLRGYIGIDILITDNEILLVEINPRLTTSYAGLNSALGINPAAYMLHTFINQQLPKFIAAKNDTVTLEIGAECAA